MRLRVGRGGRTIEDAHGVSVVGGLSDSDPVFDGTGGGLVLGLEDLHFWIRSHCYNMGKGQTH